MTPLVCSWADDKASNRFLIFPLKKRERISMKMENDFYFSGWICTAALKRFKALYNSSDNCLCS